MTYYDSAKDISYDLYIFDSAKETYHLTCIYLIKIYTGNMTYYLHILILFILPVYILIFCIFVYILILFYTGNMTYYMYKIYTYKIYTGNMIFVYILILFYTGNMTYYLYIFYTCKICIKYIYFIYYTGNMILQKIYHI